MKILVLIISVLTFGIFQNDSVEKGIEIYQIQRTNPDFTKKNKGKCSYCLEIAEKDLFEKPLISENQITDFDWENQKIELTEEAKLKLKKMEIPLGGTPVAMVLNGQIIYCFWLWNEHSSFGCDRVFTYTSNNLELRFGLPITNTFGTDPRFDNRLKNYLDEQSAKN